MDIAFAFQPNGQYTGDNPIVSIINREEVIDFIGKNPRQISTLVYQCAASASRRYNYERGQFVTLTPEELKASSIS
jgi:hypothetical protein